MAEHYDLWVRGGRVVDGTGAPARRGDVAVRAGCIAAVGTVRGSADRVIDAEGAVVAPGFVDIHTHYDAQVLWDRMLTVSPWHGVTSLVMGNCGFGVAPTRPAHRDLILETLESVEGMSLDALRAGLGDAWPFESFPEYLDVVAARGVAVNVGALVGHTPLRTFVLGHDAVEREATPEEVARMAACVDGALAAGALGFATSKAPTHVGHRGHPVPSRRAAFDEVAALAARVGARGHGVVQATIGQGLAIRELSEIARRTGRPVTWTALLADLFPADAARSLLDKHAALQADGVQLVPQVACRPLVTEFQMKAPFPLESAPVMGEVSRADAAGRRRLYADPEFRVALRAGLAEGVFGSRLREARISEYAPDPSLLERSLEEVARERRVHVVDVLLDLSLATGLEARFRIPMANTDEAVVADLLRHPASVLGLSDAGAHASQLCDAGAATTLLGRWVREKQVLTLEEGVRRLTSQPADLFGLADRGRLAPGRAADLCVFDPDTVGCAPVRRVHDLPGGADRLVADARGVRAVVVNGVPIREGDHDLVDPEGPLPGVVLRGGF